MVCFSNLELFVKAFSRKSANNQMIVLSEEFLVYKYEGHNLLGNVMRRIAVYTI